MTTKINRIMRLRALAVDQRGTPEGEAALRRAASLYAALTPEDRARCDAAGRKRKPLPIAAIGLVMELSLALPGVEWRGAPDQGVWFTPAGGTAADVPAAHAAALRALEWARRVQREGQTLRGLLDGAAAALRRLRYGLDPDLDTDPDPTEEEPKEKEPKGPEAPPLDPDPYGDGDLSGWDAADEWAMDHGWDRWIRHVLNGEPLPSHRFTPT